jgi:hypothetical protein
MTFYFKNGATFRPANEEAMNLHDNLPPGNYVIKVDPFENLYFEKIDDFDLPTRIYGDTIQQADRILTTFQDRPATTGVLLSGEKGSGKTMLAKMLSVRCAEQGIPTIIINSPWVGDKFNTLMQDIQQPCVVLFDEFEKTYDRDEQTQILTLLDGVFPSKKLFILTCNDQWRIDSHMRNRPGRIYYSIDFSGLDQTFITEYCNVNLKETTHISAICKLASLFSEFNFDMLKAVVEEMNRYGETPQQALKMLNAKPTTDRGGKYKITLQRGSNVVKLSDDEFYHGNPIAAKDNISIYEDEPPVGVESLHVFELGDITEVNPIEGSFVFKNRKGMLAKFTKVKDPAFDFWAF